ncbi:MAG: hypothetical protein ACFFBD_08415 [Candidatus Hodarchaeota archaeon]
MVIRGKYRYLSVKNSDVVLKWCKISYFSKELLTCFVNSWLKAIELIKRENTLPPGIVFTGMVDIENLEFLFPDPRQYRLISAPRFETALKHALMRLASPL